MQNYLVFALVPSAHRQQFETYLERYETSFPLCTVLWIVKSDFTASQIHKQLRHALPPNAQLLVWQIGREAEFSNLDQDARAHLLAHKLL